MPSHALYRRCFALIFFFLASFQLWESRAEEDVMEYVLTFNQSNIELSGVELGGKCKSTKQCLIHTSNSTCSEEGICICQNGYFRISEVNASFCETDAADATDEDYSGSPRPPKARQQYVDVKMIIIMVVLAVMFIGICTALHLFSKARFRDHRSIFNSPHPRLMHIKLGKKKSRRRASHTSLEPPASRQLSICSQLSPLQSRRGSQVPSPEFCSSQKSRRSNGERRDTLHSHRVHKTEGSVRGRTDLTNGPGSPKVVVTSNKANPPNTSSASARV